MTRLIASIILTVVMAVFIVLVSPFMFLGVLIELLEGRR